ncbi:hypothetical protein C808_01900 [Lachnospiraceae bacterium M18-1]|nr:hypothetical protein C808_01900 [Lachnospiraceae bacterium M18-1]
MNALAYAGRYSWHFCCCLHLHQVFAAADPACFKLALRQTEELPPAGFLNRQNLTKEERG